MRIWKIYDDKIVFLNQHLFREIHDGIYYLTLEDFLYLMGYSIKVFISIWAIQSNDP